MVNPPLKVNIYTLWLIVGIICATTNCVYSSQRHKFCGPKLVKELAKVCLAFPTLPSPNKRTNGVDMNDYNSLLTSQDWQYTVEQPNASHLTAEEKFKHIPRWMKALFPKYDTKDIVEEDYFNELIPDRFMLRKRDGIVEECCKRGCTYEYLIMNYCDTSQLMK